MNYRLNNRYIIRSIIFFIAFGIFSCSSNKEIKVDERTGKFKGVIEYGNFSDEILFEIERDSVNPKVYFTSLNQNAIRIPFRNVEVSNDSINFMLQSDYYNYFFRNKWVENNSKLQGVLLVDTITVPYTLKTVINDSTQRNRREEVNFVSNGLTINGTIWHPTIKNSKAIVLLTSSGKLDRSASRAEAIRFAEMGFTTFHYDKRGTGSSEGNWQIASMEELIIDDINAINYFSDKTKVPFTKIGIKGSSQGATKVPYILNELENLDYGVVVSCPGVSLLESDLNYWKNKNVGVIGSQINEAAKFQRKVFEFIAGKVSRADLEKDIESQRLKSWFPNVWMPILDEVKIDKKLLYSPIPYFESIKQPVLIIQGKKDEIIPSNSYSLISKAIKKSYNDNFKVVLIEGASHSMYNIGESDFPYWSKLHTDYFTTIEDWISIISNNDNH
jgi:pimeloyl-ACP methyl ester carboxylesterase